MTEDDQLMVRLQEGDSRAFDALVLKYQGALIGFFLRNTRDRQLSEDLSQETLLRVYSQSWDYLPAGRFRGWMYRIARNLLIDSIRRQSHDALIRACTGHKDDETDALARLVAKVVSPDDLADQREIAALVDGFLAELPEDQRLTFTLHHYSGLTLAEVAEVMDTSLPTSKSRLRLAREKLREKLRTRGVSDPNDPVDDGA